MKGIICNQCKKVITEKIFHVDITPLKIRDIPIKPRSILYRIEDRINVDSLDFCCEEHLIEFFKNRRIKNDTRRTS
jgi:hypothetical protein